jgi:hypothetical protein
MSGWLRHEIVIDAYDPDYGDGQTVGEYYECDTCSAIVADQDKHDAWHYTAMFSL